MSYAPPLFVVESVPGGQCTRPGGVSKEPRQMDVAVFRAGAFAKPFLVVEARRRSRAVDFNGMGALEDHRGEAGALLSWVAESLADGGWRYDAVRHLIEQGALDSVRRDRHLEREPDREVRELLITESRGAA